MVAPPKDYNSYHPDRPNTIPVWDMLSVYNSSGKARASGTEDEPFDAFVSGAGRQQLTLQRMLKPSERCSSGAKLFMHMALFPSTQHAAVS